MRQFLTPILSVGLLLVAGTFSSTAEAVPVLKLECRIDNRLMESVPRPIELRNGMIETIDCQTHDTCSNSIYAIEMNYNSSGETVSVAVRDTETKKSIWTEFTVPQNTTGDSLYDANFGLGYGDTLTSLGDIEKLDPKGRFLKIDCTRRN